MNDYSIQELDDDDDYDDDLLRHELGASVSPTKRQQFSQGHHKVTVHTNNMSQDDEEGMSRKRLSSKDFIQSSSKEGGSSFDPSQTEKEKMNSSRGLQATMKKAVSPPGASQDEDEEEEYEENNGNATIEGRSRSSSEEDEDFFNAFERYGADMNDLLANSYDVIEPRSMSAGKFIPDTFISTGNPIDLFGRNKEEVGWLQYRQRRHEKFLDELRQKMKFEFCLRAQDPSNLKLDCNCRRCSMYNAADYENLKVSPEIKDLFEFITKFQPPVVHVGVKLKPFIPEYYPSVGDIDAFIKVIHPEIKNDGLGVRSLDEPSAFQSDPSVLDLRLRALAKQSSAKAVVVKKVDNVQKNANIIENWIKDISDLHRSKPSPSVHYSKPMPDIDILLQEWPTEMDELLKTVALPSPELDCDLSTYVDIICSLLDIPVHKSKIQSLHVLFTLYAACKHLKFNQYGSGMRGSQIDLMPSSTSLMGHVDTLQL